MHRLPTVLAIVAAGAFAGCGGAEESTPVACVEGPALYEERGRGDVPISHCLVKGQGGADLAEVGAAMLRAATRLNAEARAAPGGAANARLGYLVGAAQRAAEETEGIHDELVRRLAAAARYAPGNQPPPPAFMRAYRRGFDAGRRRG